MKRQTGVVILSLGLVCIILGVIYLSTSTAKEASVVATGPFVGQIMPDLIFQTLEGEEVRLADYRGKIIFLNFWTTWCPACVAEKPGHQKVYTELADRDDLAFIWVSVNETPQTVRSYMAGGRYTFPVFLDPRGRALETALVRGYPTSFFIDAQGVVRYRISGPLTPDQIRNGLELTAR